jgi:hypothetical protein
LGFFKEWLKLEKSIMKKTVINWKGFNPPEKESPVHIGKEAGWASEPVWTL